MWLIVSAVIALAVTRGTLVVLFLALFLVVWMLGYGVLARVYK